jgi:serine/threonine protein kinase
MATSTPGPEVSIPEPEPNPPPATPTEPPVRSITPPTPGETITSALTRQTYTMGHKIGEGSFGVVYACSDGWNNQLAAKILLPRQKTYEEVKASAEAELQKLALLRHPYITHVFDAFEYRDTFYIITERCTGTLAAFFSQEWFHGPIWIPAVARCILQAVEFVHFNGMVHQDIHPGNVFATLVKDELLPQDSGATQFRLGDLGIAKFFGELSPQNTRAQWLLPPEALDPSQFGLLDSRIDIYHCGLLFLQLALSREVQFSPEEIMSGKPRDMALQLPQPFNFALEKALRRHVSLRTATAMELWRDLNSPGTAQPAPSEPELPFPTQQGPTTPTGLAALAEMPSPDPITPNPDEQKIS